MSVLSSDGAAVSPQLTAGLLLAAIPVFERLNFLHPTASTVVEALGVSRSRAYELRDAILALLPTAQRSPGRPAAAPAPAVDLGAIIAAARDFAYAHPGAVTGAGARRRYSDAFRHFALDIAATHRALPLDPLAVALGIPCPTLKDWLSAGRETVAPPASLASVAPIAPTDPQLQTLLAVWKTWEGGFAAFCRHVQHDWRIPFGRTLIAEILAGCGVRFARRRSGRSPDEDALRGQFETWFPNAQLVGDGTELVVEVDGQAEKFNVELMIDPCSGAFVGASVRDTEDAAAVVEAFDDALRTTGEAPLAVLLDNKPSNHGDDVATALAPATIVPATPYRPQNKAHVEGGFGLFKPHLPPLSIVLGTPREIAAQLVIFAVTLFGRMINRRKRRDRGGKSRIDLHRDNPPTPEEIESAKAAIGARVDKQRKARETWAARVDSRVRGLITDGLARLRFPDPLGEFLPAIARYPVDAVAEGIAVVLGKQRAATLPEGADARYLLGVVRNIANERENWEIGLALWEVRERARDAMVAELLDERDTIAEETADVEKRAVRYTDRALGAARWIDRRFWLNAAADVVLDEPEETWQPTYRLLVRRIAATHAVPHRERIAACRALAARIVPIS